MQVIMELAWQITALEYAPDFRMEEDTSVWTVKAIMTRAAWDTAT